MLLKLLINLVKKSELTFSFSANQFAEIQNRNAHLEVKCGIFAYIFVVYIAVSNGSQLETKEKIETN